jgi:hypothetical protein
MTERDTRIPAGTHAALAHQLEEQLLDRYGPLLGGFDLAKVLGYPTMRAFQQAVARGVVGVPVFPMEKRRGRFALASEVAAWLARQRVTTNAAVPTERKQ